MKRCRREAVSHYRGCIRRRVVHESNAKKKRKNRNGKLKEENQQRKALRVNGQFHSLYSELIGWTRAKGKQKPQAQVFRVRRSRVIAVQIEKGPFLLPFATRCDWPGPTCWETIPSFLVTLGSALLHRGRSIDTCQWSRRGSGQVCNMVDGALGVPPGVREIWG